jgi:hypothetical protein
MSKTTLLVFILLVILPALASAQTVYTPLVNIFGDGTDPSFNNYINLLYSISISLAALLAVVKIIIAGAKYMLSDVSGTKSDAKGEITGALLGLLLIVGAYVILNVINPQLLENDLTGNFKKIPASTQAKSSSLGTMATPPALGKENLLDTLDLDKVPGGNAEKSAAFEKFKTDCTSKGGAVVLVNEKTRDCKNIVKPSVVTNVGGSQASLPLVMEALDVAKIAGDGTAIQKAINDYAATCTFKGGEVIRTSSGSRECRDSKDPTNKSSNIRGSLPTTENDKAWTMVDNVGLSAAEIKTLESACMSDPNSKFTYSGVNKPMVCLKAQYQQPIANPNGEVTCPAGQTLGKVGSSNVPACLSLGS